MVRELSFCSSLNEFDLDKIGGHINGMKTSVHLLFHKNILFGSDNHPSKKFFAPSIVEISIISLVDVLDPFPVPCKRKDTV